MVGEIIWELHRQILDEVGGQYLIEDHRQVFRGVGGRTVSDYRVWFTVGLGREARNRMCLCCAGIHTHALVEESLEVSRCDLESTIRSL